MTMASYLAGKPIMVKAGPPGSGWNAGDVLVYGGMPFVAHEDNPMFGGVSTGTPIVDALAAFGGLYIMTADASYAPGTFVFWDSVLQQVTAQIGANRVPFGQIVGGANNNITDAAGTAVLVFHDPEPEMRFGGSTFAAGQFSSFGDEGNLYRNIGNPIAGNAADTTDDILAGIVLAGNAFDLSGRGIAVTASGKTGATTNNKRIKIWANPTMAGQTVTNGVISGGTVSGAGAGVLLFDSGTWVNGTTPNNAVGWQLFFNWFKYGANGSNTQCVQGSVIEGATHGGISVPAFTTIPENALINLVVTGSSYTTGAANDVLLNFFEVNAMN